MQTLPEIIAPFQIEQSEIATSKTTLEQVEENVSRRAVSSARKCKVNELADKN